MVLAVGESLRRCARIVKWLAMTTEFPFWCQLRKAFSLSCAPIGGSSPHKHRSRRSVASYANSQTRPTIAILSVRTSISRTLRNDGPWSSAYFVALNQLGWSGRQPFVRKGVSGGANTALPSHPLRIRRCPVQRELRVSGLRVVAAQSGLPGGTPAQIQRERNVIYVSPCRYGRLCATRVCSAR